MVNGMEHPNGDALNPFVASATATTSNIFSQARFRNQKLSRQKPYQNNYSKV